MKNRPVGADLFHTDGRTDRQNYLTTLIVAFEKASQKEFPLIILGPLKSAEVIQSFVP
jgi:hypothetical protein